MHRSVLKIAVFCGVQRTSQRTALRSCRALSSLKANSPSVHCPHRQPATNLRKLHISAARSSPSKVVAFNLSDIGEGISEVTIKEWFVKEGDTVKQFDSICEVQSDKASVTITSRYDGRIARIHHLVEAVCKVGQPLVDIEIEGGASDAPSGGSSPATATPSRQAPPTPSQAPPTRTSSVNVVPFKLSDIGEGISEVSIKEWFVKVGDTVKQFDPICEVQSDKASVTITSRYDGVIRTLHYDVDAICKVGAALVDIEIAGEPPSTPIAPVAASHTAARAPAPATSQESKEQSVISGKVLATPAVRRMAIEMKISLSEVPSTGKGGRVLKDDIYAYLESKESPAASVSVQPPSQVAPPGDKDQQRGQAMRADTVTRTVPVKGFQKVMLKTMTKSLLIPHFGYKDEVDVTSLVEMRKDLVEEAKKFNVKLSYMPFFIKAASLALQQFPILNSSLDDSLENLTFKGDHNIGLAMDTPNGLVVPNIKNCEAKSILEIGADLNRLHRASLGGQLQRQDLVGGTFSLSNIGSIGGTYADPVIVSPEVCIGAVGKIQKIARLDKQNQLVPLHALYVSWSADHRVIDGATMARFSNIWKDYLEKPHLLMLHLR